MNLNQPNANDALQTKNRSRNVAPQSGICSRCLDGCKGNCDMFKATFPNVDTETEYGVNEKVKMKVPIFTGALGSTDIARKNWDHFAIGAAISGISLVCGENVCGIDPALEIGDNGLIKNSPEMDRRIEAYRRYHEGYGDVMIQMNVEDTRNGVAEYVIEKHGVETIELKWGQGAKCIGGEIKVNSLERAIELKKRGYIVTPDPEDPAHQAAFKAGPLKQFERHSRLGFVDQEGFMNEVQRLRALGAKRITLKTGAYPMRELAMAIRWSSDADIDLLTIDGAPGGTGMSPWRMMTEWGIPAIYLHAMAYELCERLVKNGKRAPDLAFAGGFSSEDHVFKALALGAPYCKAVCMGRALMIPGMVGKNAERWLRDEDGGLPKTVSKFGFTKEEIFMNYEVLKGKYGSEIDNLPLGAIGLFNVADKIKVGLQQLMAGSRNWKVEYISRDDIFSLTEECAKITGIPYVMDAYRQEALEIIDA